MTEPGGILADRWVKMRKVTIGRYTRISKAAARKLWDSNQSFAIVGCKMRPDSWAAFTVTRGDTGATFDQLMNEWHYYNARYETGYFPAFYSES